MQDPSLLAMLALMAFTLLSASLVFPLCLFV